MSIVEEGLIAGGTSDGRGTEACFFPAVDPLEEPLPDFTEFPKDEPRMVHGKGSKKQITMQCTHLI